MPEVIIEESYNYAILNSLERRNSYNKIEAQ
jgi:hypothetical protein